jgi:hypothetical protein
VLSLTEFFPKTWLRKYSSNGSELGGHVTSGSIPGVELSTGSLGHGMPYGLGISLSRKRNKVSGKTYVIMSDGECDEGTTWESALIANHFGLNNFCVIIDRNNLQSMGSTESTLALEPFAEKWKAFGWDVIEIDGHNFKELVDEFDIGYRYREHENLLFVRHSLLEQDFYDFDLEDLNLTTAEDLIDYPILAAALRGLPERPWTKVTKTVNPFYDDLEEEDRAYDMDDIEVTINLEFEENLTWKNLHREKQLQLFSLLKIGLLSSNQEIAGASEHFLGCMALHPNTPQDILSELAELGNELIQEVLDSKD